MTYNYLEFDDIRIKRFQCNQVYNNTSVNDLQLNIQRSYRTHFHKDRHILHWYKQNCMDNQSFVSILVCIQSKDHRNNLACKYMNQHHYVHYTPHSHHMVQSNKRPVVYIK